MNAIRVEQFGGPDVMKLQDVPDPRADQGQVLVRMKAIGVNPVDTYIRSGTYARKPNLPYTPGSDSAGIVEAVGANVSFAVKKILAFDSMVRTLRRRLLLDARYASIG